MFTLPETVLKERNTNISEVLKVRKATFKSISTFAIDRRKNLCFSFSLVRYNCFSGFWGLGFVLVQLHDFSRQSLHLIVREIFK